MTSSSAIISKDSRLSLFRWGQLATGYPDGELRLFIHSDATKPPLHSHCVGALFFEDNFGFEFICGSALDVKSRSVWTDIAYTLRKISQSTNVQVSVVNANFLFPYGNNYGRHFMNVIRKPYVSTSCGTVKHDLIRRIIRKHIVA